MTWQVWVRTTGPSGTIWVAVRECASQAEANAEAVTLWLKHTGRSREDFRIAPKEPEPGAGPA